MRAKPVAIVALVLLHRPVRPSPRLAVTAVAALTVTMALLLMFIVHHPARYASKDLAVALRPRLTPHAHVFVVDRYEDLSSFDFYLDRPIYVLNPSQGDLYYGIRHFPHPRRLITGTRLQRLIHHHTVFIVGARSQAPVWQALGHFHVVASNRHDVVVENDHPARTRIRGRRAATPRPSHRSPDAPPPHG